MVDGTHLELNDGQRPYDNGQAEYPRWIKPALITEAKDVLRASNRPSADQDAIDLIVAIGRLLDAAGVLRANKP